MVATGAIEERLAQAERERAQREALAEALVRTTLAQLRCRVALEDATAPGGRLSVIQPTTIGLVTVGWRIEAE